MNSGLNDENVNDSQTIHTACRNGNVESVKLLLDEESNIEACDENDQRPIHIACEKGHVGIVELLLEQKCNIEAHDKFQRRPIHFGCYNGSVEIVKLFLKKCNIEERDWKKQAPLHIACCRGHFNIVNLLLEEGCNIEANDKENQRPIHIACDKGYVSIVKLLLEKNCDIEAHDKFYRRPIHLACGNGNVDIVKLLLNKCNIEERDWKNQGPLHIACRKGHFGIANLLLEKKCDIEANDKNNWRPIHFASQFGSVEIVKLLIAYKCDIDACTKDNKSPLDIAMQGNHERVINIIKYELFKEKLITKLYHASTVECGTDCDHESCPKKLIPSASQNETLIGKGIFGNVFKLTDPETKFKYAMKSIELESGTNKEVKNSIEININNYRNIIKHSRIVEYFGSVLYSMTIYIFMELMPKGSLSDEIAETGSLPHQRIIRYTKQILEGLEFLHGQKVIHRDLKPKNILLDDNDCTKLCDFGLSKVLESISTQSGYKVVQANTECGTPHFMAPEIMIGEGYSFSVDIWSVGATMVNMLTGHVPYSNMNLCRVIFKIGTDKKIEFQSIEPMSEDMTLFMTQILNPDPLKRSTAKELLQFLIHHDMTRDDDATYNRQELE